jgi:ubiquinone biosynthesis monooxygenase Coq6
MPYAQERYFENHKFMAALDKLHKLYSTSFGPVVWARSVGLEVLNEFDSIKAAIMMNAGGSKRSGIGPGVPSWSRLAVSGVEGLGMLRQVGGAVSGMFGSVLQGFIDRTSKGREQKS